MWWKLFKQVNITKPSTTAYQHIASRDRNTRNMYTLKKTLIDTSKNEIQTHCNGSNIFETIKLFEKASSTY